MNAEKAKSGWQQLLLRLARLIDVKSIVTLALVAVLCFLTAKQLPVNDLFSNAVMLVLGFFFGKNLNEKKESEGEKNE